MNRAQFVLPLAAACAALLPLSPARASVIYNNRMFSPGGWFGISEPGEASSSAESGALPPNAETDSRVGDTITFGGPATDRFITSFSTRIWSFEQPVSPISVSLELSLYTRSGITGLPDQVLWSGAVNNVSLTGALPVIVDFAPNTAVPDTICFGIAFTSISGTRGFGVVSSSGVAAGGAVGSSPNTYLLQDTATQAWRFDDLSSLNGGIFRHVDAVVTAVPAPSTLAAIFPAGICIALRRSRRIR